MIDCILFHILYANEGIIYEACVYNVFGYLRRFNKVLAKINAWENAKKATAEAKLKQEEVCKFYLSLHENIKPKPIFDEIIK